MPGQLVTVATFVTPAEAELARQRLEHDGIPACLAEEHTGAVLGLTTGGLSSVKVMVNAADRERAEAILAATEDRHDQDDEDAGTWTCSQCGTELSTEFEVCWSCGTTVDGQTDPSFVREPEDSLEEDETPDDDDAAAQGASYEPDAARPIDPPPAIDRQTDNPYRAPGVPTAPVVAAAEEPPLGDTTYSDEVAARAWRASVLSAILCPPLLTFYSVWLVVQIAFTDHALSAAGMRKFYGAMAVNILVWVMAVLVLHRLFLR